MKRPDNKNLPTLDGSRFLWSNLKGTAFVSDVANAKQLFGRVWNDACDVGFFIRSHRTCRNELFILSNTLKDNEGDVQGWEFESVREDEKGRRVVVTVFND